MYIYHFAVHLIVNQLHFNKIKKKIGFQWLIQRCSNRMMVMSQGLIRPAVTIQ